MKLANGTLKPEKVVNIRKELNYQKQSVVSRALLEVASGAIDIMALDTGLGIAKHVFKQDALLLVLEGNLKIEMSSGVHILEKEDAFLIPEGKSHSMLAVVPTKILLITFAE